MGPVWGREGQNGYILLVYSCLLSMSLIIFTAGYLSYQENQFRAMDREISSLKAFYIAQAGLNKVSLNMQAGQNVIPLQDNNFAGGSYTVTSLANNPDTYSSTGSFHDVSRTLQAKIAYHPPTDFEGALYIDNDFQYYGAIPGTINSGKYYAFQTADNRTSSVVNNIKNHTLDIISTADPNTYLFDRPRTDYTNIVNKLVPENTKWRKIATDLNNPTDGNANRRLISNHKVSKTSYHCIYMRNGNKTMNEDNCDYQYCYSVDNNKNIIRAELTIHDNRGLTLETGTYYFSLLTLETGATLNVNGQVMIFSVGQINMYKESQIGNSGRPSDLSLHCRVVSETSDKIYFYESSQCYGSILAPGFEVWFYEGSLVNGALLVKNFFVQGTGAPNPPRWNITFDESLRGQGGTPQKWLEVFDNG